MYLGNDKEGEPNKDVTLYKQHFSLLQQNHWLRFEFSIIIQKRIENVGTKYVVGLLRLHDLRMMIIIVLRHDQEMGIISA